jgi:HEAT repeat protein
MSLKELFSDKTIKAKQLVEILSNRLLDKTLAIEELITFAETAKDAPKGTCIEAIEFATRQQADIANLAVFQFVTQTLKAKAARVQWESAKVVGNTARLFPEHLDTAIVHLLDNTEAEGTVVRWSAAFALGEILKLKTTHNDTLLPALESVCETESQNSIKKIYLAAFKAIGLKKK